MSTPNFELYSLLGQTIPVQNLFFHPLPENFLPLQTLFLCKVVDTLGDDEGEVGVVMGSNPEERGAELLEWSQDASLGLIPVPHFAYGFHHIFFHYDSRITERV